jgi:hypothetical protein
MMKTADLHRALIAAAPGMVVGVAIGDPADKRSWRIDFADEATPAHIAAAQAALAAFDPAAPVEEKRAPAELLALLSEAELGKVIDGWIASGAIAPARKAELLGKLERKP